jgi:hypothetical protein
MRHRSILFTFAFLALLSIPALLAQKFQEPTREELAMTADPKAPGAPAIYLYREEKTDNYSHYISEYARIKILTEQGKEWATVEVPYAGGGAPPIIEGRTIHADGSIVPLTGTAASLLTEQSVRGHAHAHAFTLPAAEAGSILEYHWTLPDSESHTSGVTNDNQGLFDSALAGKEFVDWDVQLSIPIRKEKFYYNPLSDLERNVTGNQSIIHYVDGEIANYLLFSARLPAGVHLAATPNRDYALELNDIPAFHSESDATPEQGRIYAVHFYYTPYSSADVYWTDEGKRWSREIDRAAEPSGELKTATAGLVAGATTDEAKARKLYDAVQGLNNSTFLRGLSPNDRARLGRRLQVRPASQVWAGKAGARNEIAILYIALARAAGLDARAMAIADRSERIFDPGLLSFDQLTTVLAVVRINGADVFLDPGEKLLPFGQLRWNHQLCTGLLQSSEGVQRAVVTPPGLSKDSLTAHAADLTLSSTGAVTGTVKILLDGQAALDLRQATLSDGPDEAKSRLWSTFAPLLPAGVNGEIDKIQGLETAQGFVSATVKLSGQLGTVNGKRLTLPAFFFSTGPQPRFVQQDHRDSTIDLHYAEQTINDAVYHLPAGFAVQSAPQPVQLPWPEHAAMVVKTTQAANQIEIKHVFARSFILLDAKAYPLLRDYYQKLATNDQQKLVLAPANY